MQKEITKKKTTSPPATQTANAAKSNKVARPHDSMFKHNFSNKEVVRHFLQHNLSKSLLARVDLDTLALENSEFLSSRYRSQRNADIIYAVKDKSANTIYIRFHLEAQSNHDRHMAFRVWEYHVALARSLVKKGVQKLPLIRTFVFYHGKKKWDSPRSVAALFEDFDTYVQQSLKESFLIDLNEVDVARLSKQEAAAAPQLMMKAQTSGSFCDILPTLCPLAKKYGQLDEENIDYMATYEKRGMPVLLENLRKLAPGITDDYITMFEAAIRREAPKWRQEGKQEGIELGRQEGIQATIQQLLASGMPKKKLAQILHMSMHRLDRLLEPVRS